MLIYYDGRDRLGGVAKHTVFSPKKKKSNNPLRKLMCMCLSSCGYVSAGDIGATSLDSLLLEFTDHFDPSEKYTEN